jgi:PIN domain nuclease of toxin-antitoxin system
MLAKKLFSPRLVSRMPEGFPWNPTQSGSQDGIQNQFPTLFLSLWIMMNWMPGKDHEAFAGYLTLLWWWGEPSKLPPCALSLLTDPTNEIFVSAASTIEISTKTRLGRLANGIRIIESWGKRLKLDEFREISLTCEHSLKAEILPGKLCDPFDRLIAAQSLVESIPVLGCDPMIPEFGVQQHWLFSRNPTTQKLTPPKLFQENGTPTIFSV